MPTIEIRRNRWYYAIPTLLLIILISVLSLFVVKSKDAANALETKWYVIAGLILLVAAFLLIHFVRQFFRNPIIFRVNDTGFEYSPAGVSTGFIPWTEVKAVRELSMLKEDPDKSQYETVLGVTLKDPELFRTRYNKFVSKLFRLNEGLYDASIFISQADLGKKYDLVKGIMIEKAGQKPNIGTE
jgi:hypothetical protein